MQLFTNMLQTDRTNSSCCDKSGSGAVCEAAAKWIRERPTRQVSASFSSLQDTAQSCFLSLSASAMIFSLSASASTHSQNQILRSASYCPLSVSTSHTVQSQHQHHTFHCQYKAAYHPFAATYSSVSASSRLVHEAFQFLTMRKKKKSGRSMAENWGAAGGKTSLLKVTTLLLSCW